MTVSVAVFNAHPRRRVRREGVVRTIRRVAAGEGYRSVTISVVFIDGRTCARINRRYLGHRGSTDVISFPLGEGREIEGEIYVNLDRTKRQAKSYGVTEADEITRLVVHGALHLLGYDDRTLRSQRQMKAREDAYVGVPAQSGKPERAT